MTLRGIVQKEFVGQVRSIGTASRESGVPRATLRGWDHWIQPHWVTIGGQPQRLYDDPAMKRIAGVREAREVLRGIRALPSDRLAVVKKMVDEIRANLLLVRQREGRNRD